LPDVKPFVINYGTTSTGGTQVHDLEGNIFLRREKINDLAAMPVKDGLS
jgi:hypothetical protein